MSTSLVSPHTYKVDPRARKPLIDFIVAALEGSGCTILHRPSASEAPFRFTFETADGERVGILVYAFLANNKLTKNRPSDEHRFQMKYGPDTGDLQTIWQDPYDLYTTLLVGINPEEGFFVGADPVLHNPTRFFISIEFKQAEVDQLLKHGWHAWERDRRDKSGEPVEVLVGGTAPQFLRFIRFERDAVGEDQGHRQLLAEKPILVVPRLAETASPAAPPPAAYLHQLTREFELSESEVLDLIAGARRLKMAVRGWVAEHHLVQTLRGVPGVTDLKHSDVEGGPDVLLRFESSQPISIECKNVLRERNAAGTVRMDFQRTRASKADPCSRYYSSDDFDVVAACLHAVEERWVFKFARSRELDAHPKCYQKLSHLVRLDQRWDAPVQQVLRAVGNR